MKTKFNMSDGGFYVSTDVREYIACRLENCFSEAEIYGFNSACWRFLHEMADMADRDIDEMTAKYSF